MTRPGAEGEDPLFTLAVRSGEPRTDPHRPLSPPVYLSSAFEFPDPESVAAIHAGETPGYFYGRMGTPTQAALESALCALENGESALALASGMAAITTAILSRLEPGAEIVAPHALYATTGLFLDDMLAGFGFRVRSVDAARPGAYEEAITPRTRLLYLETPSNPTLQITEIASVVAAARRHGVTTILDNTLATPFNQRPLDLGIDLAVHSATKYLSGHGDLVAGAIVGRRELVERARRHTAKILGGTLSPLTAWLVLRGLRTLPLRMARHNSTASRVAAYLQNHRAVRAVHYPGLPSHPQHALAASQMRGFGGIVAFDVGSRAAGERLIEGLRLARLAVSLGDVSTLVQLSSAATHRAASAGRRSAAGIGEGLVRLSVGLERLEDILADLEQGLRRL